MKNRVMFLIIFAFVLSAETVRVKASDNPTMIFGIPGWIWIALSVMGAGLIMFIGLNIYLKREVNRKTLSLKKSEENLRITLESIGDGVIATDAEGKVTMINKTAERLTGWKPEECAGIPMNDIFKIVNVHTREIVSNPADIVIKNGKTVGLANHTVLISKDGTEYQIADSASPIIDKNGTIHGMILVFSDVTEKYEVQEKIAENERFLNSLISNLNGMVYRCSNDEKWSMIYTTGGSEEITGYKPEEYISGKVRYSDIVFPEDIGLLKDSGKEEKYKIIE